MKNEIINLAKENGILIIHDSLNINESGVDFCVAHALDVNEDKWIFKMPRRLESMRHATIEKKALDALIPLIEINVPNWLIFTDALIAYKQLPGAPVAAIDIVNQEYIWSFDVANVPPEYYITLGKALAKIHALPVTQFNDIGLEFVESNQVRKLMKQRMENVYAGYEINPNLWERWQSWVNNESYWPSHVGIKHGDLHPGHIIIDDKNNVTGIIDWSEIGVGDVSVDFLSQQLLFGDEGLKKLIDSYDNAGGKTWDLMAEHIVELLTTSAITVAEYAEATGLSEMHETAKAMLLSE